MKMRLTTLGLAAATLVLTACETPAPRRRRTPWSPAKVATAPDLRAGANDPSGPAHSP